MGLGDRIKKAVQAVKSEAVIAKANHDSGNAGYDPKDYAGFNGEGLSPDSEAKPKSAYQKWREREVNGE